MQDFEEGSRGLLKTAMFGPVMQCKLGRWSMRRFMVDAGFLQGLHSACVFDREQKNARVVVHGDDFTILGASKSLD